MQISIASNKNKNNQNRKMLCKIRLPIFLNGGKRKNNSPSRI